MDDLQAADVHVEWIDSEVDQRQSLMLRDLSLQTTLGELKELCASQLCVLFVQPQDFNDDMDAYSLLHLGIGSSGLPFMVSLGPSIVGGHDVAEKPQAKPTQSDGSIANEKEKACVSSSVASGTCEMRRCRPSCSPKAPSPSFSMRNALKDACNIEDGWLFLGGQTAAGSRQALMELGVTHVLNACESVPCKFKTVIKYKVINVMDTKASDIRQYFPAAMEFIDEAHESGGAILVHCMVGASRSVSLVLAWLLNRRRMPLREAFLHVRSRRSCARPNRSFCQQLMDYEVEVLGTSTATLADFYHT